MVITGTAATPAVALGAPGLRIRPFVRRQMAPPASATARAATSAINPGVIAAYSASPDCGIPDLGGGDVQQHLAVAGEPEAVDRALSPPRRRRVPGLIAVP